MIAIGTNRLVVFHAAVLTENGFIESEVSLVFLASDEGKRAIVSLHVEGIIDDISVI